MYSYLLGTAVGFSALVGAAHAADAKPTAAASLDGAWTVVCFEKGGQPQGEAKGMTVKAEAGTITCSGRDGKPAMTLEVAFGPNGTVQVTEAAADAAAEAKAGVYVLTQDYLAICVHADAAPAGAGSTPAGAGPSAKSRCTVILKREGARPDGAK